MKLWTRSEPFPWPENETHPEAKEVSGGMLDGKGRKHYVRYLGNTPPTITDLDLQVNPSSAQMLAEQQKASQSMLHSNPLMLLVQQQRTMITALLNLLVLKNIVTEAEANAIKASAL